VADRLRVKRLIGEEWSDCPHPMMVPEKGTLRKEKCFWLVVAADLT
jgi:8-oxo-dGTP diphosphatase